MQKLNGFGYTRGGSSAFISVFPVMLAFSATIVGGYSTAQSFTVSGSNLNGDIIITAPAGFIVNLDGSSTDASPITLPNVGGTVASTIIYVKFHPAAILDYNTSITVTSSGASSSSVNVTGSGASPFVYASTDNITGLVYDFSYGPSQDSALFSITGVGLSPAAGNVTVTPSSNIEVWNGASWLSIPFTIAYSGAALSTASIYKVRLKAGLAVSSYSETLTLTGGSAMPYVVAVSGVVSPDPLITVSTPSLPSFGTLPLMEYSAAQSYTVSGSDLNGNILITAPANYIINLDGSDTNASPITLVQSGGTVAATIIYVKVLPPYQATFSGNITHVSAQAVTKNVAVTAVGEGTNAQKSDRYYYNT